MSAQERADAGEGVKSSAAGTMWRRGREWLFSTRTILPTLHRYTGRWNAYADIDLTPVVDDEESAAIGRQIVADNNA